MDTKRVRSPSYPNMPLENAVEAVGKIEQHYRASPVDRQNGAKLIGYSSLSGPANKALAALASFGLVERAGKGMMRVSTLARRILHPHDESERIESLMEAAMLPRLFQEMRTHFSDIPVPPEDGVKTYLEREGFNSTAVKPAAKAFLETMRLIEKFGATESHIQKSSDDLEFEMPEDDDQIVFGGARVGDFVQWELHGVLQLETPLRVRFVSDDGEWVAVEGSRTGIPMSEVMVETPAPKHKPPVFELDEPKKASGFEEWFRAKVGAEKQVLISYRGDDDIGASEIQKLIDILAAQKKALED